MNQQQREYLIGRINSIHKSKNAELDKKYIIKHPGAPKDDADRWKLVLAGKVKPIKKPDLYTWSSHSYKLKKLYDFSKFVEKVDTKKLNSARKMLEREVQRIRDLAMLGDCEQAVALLAELEKFVA